MVKRGAHIVVLTALVALPIACAAAFGYLFYWQPDPVSPPPTELGAELEFDRHLHDLSQQWTLLFRENDRIVATDAYGQNPRVILDLLEATLEPNSRLMEHEAISPGGVRIAVNLYTPRDPASGEPTRQVIVVDTRDRSIVSVPIPNDDFELDWGYASEASWLTDDLFLIKTHRFTAGDAVSEQVRFLLYDVRNISAPVPFDFPPCPMFAVSSEVSGSLVLDSDCEPLDRGQVPLDQRQVWAIDSAGKRQATAAEVALLDERSLHRDSRFSPYEHPSTPFPLITIERVAPGMDAFGRFWEDNWYRDYLYLGDRLVRVSDALITYEADLQAALELFIWSEGKHSYLMDSEGHYRELYSGVYIGRIPTNR